MKTEREKWAESVARYAATEQPGSSVQGEAVEIGRLRVSPYGDFMGVDWNRPVTLTNGQPLYTIPPPAPAAEQGDALAAFTDYFVRNYPGPDTVIMDPRWHASRIFRAAQYAISAANQPEARGVEGMAECAYCTKQIPVTAPEPVRVDDAMVERGCEALRQRWDDKDLSEPTIEDVRAVITAALAGKDGAK